MHLMHQSKQAAQQLETLAAFQIMNKEAHLIHAGLIAFDERLKESGVSFEIRCATIAYYLTEVMFYMVSSIACCERSYKEKLERIAEALRADALKRANDPELYRTIALKLGKVPVANCNGSPEAKPTIN